MKKLILKPHQYNADQEKKENEILIEFFLDYLKKHTFIRTQSISKEFLKSHPGIKKNLNSLYIFRLHIAGKINWFIKKAEKLGVLKNYHLSLYKKSNNASLFNLKPEQLRPKCKY